MPTRPTTLWRSSVAKALLTAFLIHVPTMCGLASAQVTVNEPGFVVDVLVDGQLDGETPRIEAIRNPGYGNGAISATISNGILTVRRFSQAGIEALAVASVSTYANVLDVRFDSTGAFGGRLYVSVFNAEFQGEGPPTTEFLIVEPDGSTTTLGPIGSEENGLAMYLDFTDAMAGFQPGAYLFDLHGDSAGSSIWRLNPPPPTGDFEILAQHSVPAGRGDIDIRGLEFDQTGAFGGLIYLADADANQSEIGLIYSLSPSLVWTPFNAAQSTDTRYYRDLAFSPGGALGNRLFVTESRSDQVVGFAPNASNTVFASGFQFSSQYDHDPGGAASITVDDTGDIMYVADDAGIYKIRALGDEPGPLVLCHDPSIPLGSSLTGAAVSALRLILSEPVTFSDTDVTVTNGAGQAVPFDATGSASQFMIVAFGQPLSGDSYTVTVSDNVRSVGTGRLLDGDGDGHEGGDYLIMLSHVSANADLDADGDVDLADFALFEQEFTGPQ